MVEYYKVWNINGMDLFKRIFKSTPKEVAVEDIKSTPEQDIRDLLRENLSTIKVDAYYPHDPMLKMSDSERQLYLKKFFELSQDADVIARLVYMINNQIFHTMTHSTAGVFDISGAMTINGIKLVKDEIEKLAGMYAKENGQQPNPFNKMGI